MKNKNPGKEEEKLLSREIHKNASQDVKNAVKVSKKKQSFDKQIKNKKIGKWNAYGVFQKNKHECSAEIKNAEKFD